MQLGTKFRVLSGGKQFREPAAQRFQAGGGRGASHQQHSSFALCGEREPRSIELSPTKTPSAVTKISHSGGAGLEPQWTFLSRQVHGGFALLFRNL